MFKIILAHWQSVEGRRVISFSSFIVKYLVLFEIYIFSPHTCTTFFLLSLSSAEAVSPHEKFLQDDLFDISLTLRR